MSAHPKPHAPRVLRPFKVPAFVPDKIHDLHQWIGWRERWNAKREKPDKLPARARDGKGDGFLTPQGHSTYEEAIAAVETFNLSGVGLALMGGRIVGGDLDRCRNPINGELDAFAREVVDLAETYCEVTPSGEGLRFFAEGELPGGNPCVKYDPARVELYTSGRFLTFTGRHIAGTPKQVAPAPKTIAALVARVEAFRRQDAEAKGAAPSSHSNGKKPDDEIEAFRRFCYRNTPFGRINEAAMARPRDWVPTLFPQAEAYHDGYRVSSAALGRGLQEDISILPRGIIDFGVHDMGDPREGRRTPIDLVLEWEGSVKTAKEAAQWLARELDVPFEEDNEMPPPPGDTERHELLLASWLARDMPPKDFLVGSVLCTTSRWLMFGETGVGKSLVSYDIGAAVAAGQGIFAWTGSGQARRVMVLDGEMPAETFKDRMGLLADRYGPGLQLYGYNRDDLGDGHMPPLNTEDGEKWLMREIEAVKPDLIVFDSIMCLLDGVMSEEESWKPVKHLVRRLTARRIAQLWLHHTGHDGTKGFGTKTREWEMDTVVRLAFADEERETVTMEFRKARLRTPENASQFEAATITRGENGWSADPVQGPIGKRPVETLRIRRAFVEAYNRLWIGAGDVPGPDGFPVRKVAVETIREEVKSRGWLEQKETGGLTPAARKAFQRTKEDLLIDDRYKEEDGLFWVNRPSAWSGEVEEDAY